MKLRNAILAGLMFGMAHGLAVNAGEDKITKGYYSMDAMGCMLLKECTKDVQRINSSIDLMNAYPDANWDYVKDELTRSWLHLNALVCMFILLMSVTSLIVIVVCTIL